MHPEGTLLPQSFNSQGEGLEVSPGFGELTLLLNEHAQVIRRTVAIGKQPLLLPFREA